MRVLEIIGSVNPQDGGAIEGVLRQSAVRARRGQQTHIASLDWPDAPWVRACPVKTFGFGPSKPDVRRWPWQRYGYAPQLIPWLREHVTDYDIVIVNGLWNYTSLAARCVLPRSTVPYVVFPHGMLDPWFRVGRRLNHLAKQMLWLISEGPLLADAGAVLFTTEDEMMRAMDAFRPYDVRGRVVGYGTADLEGDPASQRAAFRRAVPALASRPFLLFLGRIHRKKGCDILVEAFARAASAHPEMNLVIAGPDPDGLRAVIQATARATGVAERIHWPGMLSGDVKWGALRDCKALVLPSHQENFGVVVAEALAAGRPVLISDQVNIWRDVKAAGAGMVATDDVEGTSRMLGDFLALPAPAIERMGGAARACFLGRFEVSIAAEAINAALEDVRTCWPSDRAHQRRR
ncbi:glycosyltransferase [Bradyrhizobium sp.]|uniref:glycosyltransferase n=1 Tax=Bradyrhizobium sp. TaxID=376 RepID=UPI001D58C860|nr:glycosyltransferase [Bradyrhizobium sp.]MBV8696537.1 glycosyltransferase [Bradyrhizobium sp.]MBV8919370.1 glycosyltransferase [Bradyrhizobium sp.]MBV9979791.1 glycosyltransferase [Bradyrhizobium sp.]